MGRTPYDHCQDCQVKMTMLESKEGDPEGLRNDYKCPKCNSVYGCSKGGTFLLRTRHGSSLKSWTPLVEGDPVNFSLGSNLLRSTIALLRNHGNANVLITAQSLERILDSQAKEIREENEAEVRTKQRAG